MNKSSSNSEFIEEKRRLLYWFTQWNKDGDSAENINLDIQDLSMLLQAAGCKLELFEKGPPVEDDPLVPQLPNSSKNHVVRIDLACTKSDMHSRLVRQITTCKCPPEEETAEGQFWSVTGYGPSTSQNNIHSSNSSLLPTISSSKLKVISHLLAKIFTIINEVDVGQNDSASKRENSLSLTRHRSLDALQNASKGNAVPTPGLKRGLSWEVDPKMSPPVGTSSPVIRLSSSLNQMSLDSGKTNVVINNLETIKKLLDETLELATGGNATFVKSGRNVKRVSDIKPTEGPSVNDLVGFQGSLAGVSSTPRNKSTPRRRLGSTGEKRQLVKPSKLLGLPRKPSVEIASPVSSLKSPMGSSIPKFSSKLVKQKYTVNSSRQKIVKSKIDTGLGAKPKVTPDLRNENQAGTSGTCSRLSTLARGASPSIKNK